MTSSVFVDTNVLAYSAHGGDSPDKLVLAIDLLRSLDRRCVHLSAQVIAEFLSVCRVKLRDEVTSHEARRMAAGFCDEFHLVAIDERIVRESLRACERYGLDYFDAQIWAAARLSGCDAILTEDTHGEHIEGVAYVNPFAEGFELERWIAGR